jgi:hypothetical protein
LTDDFWFRFSAGSDPELVDLYPHWNKADELTAVNHLFGGFVNDMGQTVPAASRIDFVLTGVSYGSDPDHPDSTDHYKKIVVTALDGMIEVPTAPYEPITYSISSRQEFYLVRGDAAVLAGGGDAGKWYVRRWDDLSPPPPSGPVINPANPKTLGSIKAQYRS